jgi:large subunit ribosomal protein L18
MSTAMLAKRSRRSKRRRRIRGKIAGTPERPRLSVHRSNRGLSAQLIDDERGHTIAAVRWIEPDLRELKPMERAARAGDLLAQRAKGAGIEACVFDRGGYKYHGQLKALADAARAGGLRF